MKRLITSLNLKMQTCFLLEEVKLGDLTSSFDYAVFCLNQDLQDWQNCGFHRITDVCQPQNGARCS